MIFFADHLLPKIAKLILIGSLIVFPVLAVAADDNLNINLTVEEEAPPPDDNGGGGGSSNIYGCTDPTADNYNSRANRDDSSCFYGGIPNVLNFTAIPTTQEIILVWQNPDYPDLAAVRVVRRTNAVPLDPGDGELVYDGIGETVTDNNVSQGNTYFYVAFIRNTAGQYSSGALASAILIPPEGEVSPPADDEPPELPGDNLPTDIFDSFPSGPDFSLADDFYILVSQPGQAVQTVRPNGSARILGDRNTSIFIPYRFMPTVLKTIGLTLFDPLNQERSFSFLLRINQDQTGYEATMGPLAFNGNYDFVLHIINYQDQSLKKIKGSLAVSATAGATTVETASRMVLAVGLIAGMVQLLAVTTQARSLLDIYLILLRLLAALSGWFGLKRRSKPWGTVYDAVTKQPIDPAVVSLINQSGREVGSAITDIDGRYGFLTSPGIYTLKAGKTHYRFPSQILAGKEFDEFYNQLYFGELITVDETGVINRNIPLDPLGFDWNEFTKNKSQFLKISSRRELIQTWLFGVLYFLGFAVAVGQTVVSPAVFDFVILALYVVIYAGQWWWRAHYPVRQLKRQGINEPLPFSVIRLFLTDLNQEVKRVVTDELGRFYLLVRPGEYYYTIEEKLPDGNYQKIYQSSPISLNQGILKEDIIVP